jgi:type III secretory pathway lipoprotein EscJ
LERSAVFEVFHCIFNLPRKSYTTLLHIFGLSKLVRFFATEQLRLQNELLAYMYTVSDSIKQVIQG